MGIYRPGPAVGAISGNVGGVSFANPSGSAVSRQPRRRSPNQQEQLQTQQANRTVISASWQALTDEQQTAWRHYAAITPSPNRLGVSRTISGWNMYSRHASYALLVTETPLTLPPATLTPPPVNVVSFTVEIIAGVKCSFTNPGAAVTVEGLVYAQNLYRETIPKFNRDWHFITKLSGTNVAGFTFTINYGIVLGVPKVDQVAALRWMPLSVDSHAPFQPFDEIVITTI